MDKKEFDINNAVLLGTAYYPEDWDEANVKVYCFATLRNGSAASDSRYLTV